MCNPYYFMILIKSIDEDITTNDVVKWILHSNESFVRLNNLSDITNIRYIDQSFIIKVDTTKNGNSSNNEYKIGINPDLTYNYNIDWGDGESNNSITDTITHTIFKNILDFVGDSNFVFNDTKVLKARIFGKKSTTYSAPRYSSV